MHFIFHQLTTLPQTESAVYEATEPSLLLLVAVLTPAHVARAAKPTFLPVVHSNLSSSLHICDHLHEDLHFAPVVLLYKGNVRVARVGDEPRD